MIIQNKKLRLIADWFGLPKTLFVIYRIKKHGDRQKMIEQLDNWKPIERTKTIPFRIAKWFANLGFF